MASIFSRPPAASSVPRWLWGALAVILIVSAAFAALSLIDTPDVRVYPKEISVEQAAEKRQTGAFILDVRQPEEWTAYHIPEATLIPLEELENRIAEVPHNTEIVVVCRTGNRSAAGREILRAAGYESVSSMAGGMEEWRAAGFPTVPGP